MAWKSQDYDYESEEGGKESKYNEASFQMKRIHELQDKINKAKINPLLFNMEEGTYGFNVIFNSLCSAFGEIQAKLTDIEYLQGKIVMARIERLMEKQPVYESSWNGSTSNYNLSFNHSNWKILRNALDNFGFLVGKFKEKHKFSSPEAEDEGMF